MKMLPGSISSGIHSVRMLSSATITASGLLLGTRGNPDSAFGHLPVQELLRRARAFVCPWAGFAFGLIISARTSRTASLRQTPKQRLARILQDIDHWRC